MAGKSPAPAEKGRAAFSRALSAGAHHVFGPYAGDQHDGADDGLDDVRRGHEEEHPHHRKPGELAQAKGNGQADHQVSTQSNRKVTKVLPPERMVKYGPWV